MNLAKLTLPTTTATFGIPGFLFLVLESLCRSEVINQSIPQLNSASQLAGISITHFGPALIVIGMLLCTFGWILRYSWTRATPFPSEDVIAGKSRYNKICIGNIFKLGVEKGSLMKWNHLETQSVTEICVLYRLLF